MDRTGARGLSSRSGQRLGTVDSQAHHPLSSSAVIRPLRIGQEHAWPSNTPSACKGVPVRCLGWGQRRCQVGGGGLCQRCSPPTPTPWPLGAIEFPSQSLLLTLGNLLKCVGRYSRGSHKPLHSSHAPPLMQTPCHPSAVSHAGRGGWTPGI